MHLLVELIVLFILFFTFSIRFSKVQTILANELSSYFTKECDFDISISELDTDFFHYIRLKNLHIKEASSVKLFEADVVWLGFPSLIELKDSIILSDLIIQSASINVIKDGEIDNVSRFISCFSKSESTGSSNFILNSIELEDINFSFTNLKHIEDKSLGEINFNNIEVSNFNFKAENIKLLDKEFQAQELAASFYEKSGFNLKEFKTPLLKIDSANISADNLFLETNNSSLFASSLLFQFNSFIDFNDFNSKVILQSEILKSRISVNDLKYFFSPFNDIHEEYGIKGKINGKIVELYLNDCSIEKLSNYEPIKFTGSASIIGLPDINNSFFNINADYLATNKNGLEKLQLLKLGGVNLSLPSNVSKLLTIEGKGFFKGYIQGFMSEFKLETGLGKLNPELNFYFDEVTKEYVYDGNILADNFNVGKLYQLNNIGKVSGIISINAKGLTIDKLKTTISGQITELFANGYNYQNILLNGVFEKNHFDGYAQINDRNLVAAYDGNINFKSKVPSYNFCMSISKANLSSIKLRDVEDAYLSLNVDINGSGFDFDNLNGEFQFTDIEYRERGREYIADSIFLYSNLNQNSNSIKIWSHILDASLEGKYNLKEIPLIVQQMASKVLPKKITPIAFQYDNNQHIDFNFNLKDISAITYLFIPDLEVSPNAKIKGNYNSIDDYLELISDVDYLVYKGVNLNGIHLETQLSDIFEVEVDLESISHLENTIKNVEVFTAVFNDNIGVQMNWSDSTSSGEIGGNGYWNELSQFKFDLHKANISTPHQSWKLKDVASVVQVDSMKYSIKEFTLYNKNQAFKLEGVLGDNFSDLFTIKIDSVKLNDVIPIKSYNIEGKMDAFVQVRSALKSPLILGRLYSDIKVNDEDFGYISAQSWMTNKDTIKISAELKNKGLKSIDLVGNYNLKDENPFDLKLELNHLSLSPINIFLPNAVKNLDGLVNGQLNLYGNISKPNFQGKLNVKDGNIKINVTNTEYSFEGDVEVTPDYIYADNAKAFDKFGNQANILSASFYHHYFKDYSYDFSVHMFEPILALNTTIDDNSLFFGKTYTTGFLNISYDKYNQTEIEVEATSHKGSEITLPLYGSEEVSIGEFISFTKFSDTLKSDEPNINLTGINMNFNLTATPEAKVKLVFDELVGDEIVAYGSGNIYMEIDQYDQFKMYGQYELDKGEYLFTLKDLINKRFDLNKGGTVSWYGDPYNAEINIDAVYKIKASVAELFPIEQQASFKNKQDVDCHMLLTNSLFSPNIGFEIGLPKSSDQVKSVVKSTISTKEELERQFFSLLLLNKFVPLQSSSLGNVGTGVSTSTSELLTNQVNQILDKWIDGVDVGVNYNNGDQFTNEEYALALSTQLFSEKLLLSGNFGVSQNKQDNGNNNTVIGDVVVEYIIDNQGVWRLKAFNQSNTYDPTKSYQGTYTQGVGVSYQKSFDTLDEIKMWESIFRLFGRKKDE